MFHHFAFQMHITCTKYFLMSQAESRDILTLVAISIELTVLMAHILECVRSK